MKVKQSLPNIYISEKELCINCHLKRRSQGTQWCETCIDDNRFPDLERAWKMILDSMISSDSFKAPSNS